MPPSVAGAARGQVDAGLQLVQRRRLLQPLQGAARAHQRYAFAWVNWLDLIQAQKRQHDLPALRGATAYKAGTPGLRHQADSVLRAQAHDLRDLGGAVGGDHDASVQVVRIPAHVQQLDGLAGGDMGRADCSAQAIQKFRGQGLHSLLPQRGLSTASAASRRSLSCALPMVARMKRS